MRLYSYFGILALILLPASAATIQVQAVDYSRGGNVSFLENGAPMTGYAGAILGSYDGGPQATFFCVDLFTPIGYGLYGSSTITPRIDRNEDRVAWLYINELWTVTTAQLGEGFQLAIWDIVHDNGDGPLTGAVAKSLSTPAAVVAAWEYYLGASLGRSSFAASIYMNTVLSNGSPAQAFIGAWNGTDIPTAHAPEPSTLLLAASALMAAGLLKRQRR
jgi:hypothetical protein